MEREVNYKGRCVRPYGELEPFLKLPFRKSVPDAYISKNHMNIIHFYNFIHYIILINALNLMHFIHWMHNYLIDPQFRKGTFKKGGLIWKRCQQKKYNGLH